MIAFGRHFKLLNSYLLKFIIIYYEPITHPYTQAKLSRCPKQQKVNDTETARREDEGTKATNYLAAVAAAQARW